MKIETSGSNIVEELKAQITVLESDAELAHSNAAIHLIHTQNIIAQIVLNQK